MTKNETKNPRAGTRSGFPSRLGQFGAMGYGRARQRTRAAHLLRMDTHPAASTHAEFLTQHDLSQKLQISERTLEDWRLPDDGPPYLKLGRHVRYDPADVAAWAKTYG